MKFILRHICAIALILFTAVTLSSYLNSEEGNAYSLKFPYAKAGLSKTQAAAHLLSRFTYGATPQQINEVAQTGLEKWFSDQLMGNLPDDSLKKLLANYDALELSNAEAVKIYPKQGQLIRMAVRDGVVNKDSVKTNKKEYQAILATYMEQNGLHAEKELFRQFINQKILRAAYSNNQLNEVMTSFWFNHFNVSITKNICAQFVPAYERDVIRPNALGKFGDLVLATAKAPAMLYYLDNFTSTANNDSAAQAGMKKPKRSQGLNENYAREVMELHTLGVDGGYTQKDVTEAARVLTGWTVFPLGQYGAQAKSITARLNEDQLKKRGFIREGDFLFAANKHDKGVKTVLGKTFDNQGYQEGVELLNMLAHHPSTAKFISHKLAVRFVSDTPPQSLVNKMANTFLTTGGDIKKVLITMVNAPEFWSTAAVREKTKSPFELAIGAVRSLNASIKQPYQLYNWINKMGEKTYFYQAPTGFPDKGQYWINTGSLLSRMNFGLALASGRIPGVTVNLKAINNNHEPESAKAALETYCRLIMPGRNPDATIKRLTPLLNDPNLMQKVDKAATSKAPKVKDALGDSTVYQQMNKTAKLKEGPTGDTQMLAQVAGIIIGSPEYQRR